MCASCAMELSGPHAVRVRSRWKRRQHARPQPQNSFSSLLKNCQKLKLADCDLSFFIFLLTKVKRQPTGCLFIPRMTPHYCVGAAGRRWTGFFLGVVLGAALVRSAPLFMTITKGLGV